ncbi:uncharacterized protein N7515_001661 [Penicillium bovifimosum]|uniref:Killer toxin Kp4 domain-containing protein n=1 Tax=Penicillium bovifimosum TaxID=126998 RepID=A0A9W9L8X2_9EURO|nr:uncharacterized protein N7515_001661 [Penicillium bovifimosum]KAJ5142874.1 hypothetical protein N7515_001661 [Penicillium bovifimosum]
MKLATFLAIVLPAISANALGINCRGSAKCSGLYGPDNVANDLKSAIDGIDVNRWYYNGEQIACVGNQAGNGGGYCAFLQNTGGTNGQWIKDIAHYIPEHGCKMCGSVPYYYPGSNDVGQGELTFNYVDNPCNVAGTQLC